jgi:hypothetical protein
MTDAVRSRFGDDYADSFDEMCALNGEAMFSGHDIQEEKREKMCVFRDATQIIVRKDSGILKRIKYRWIKCTY